MPVSFPVPGLLLLLPVWLAVFLTLPSVPSAVQAGENIPKSIFVHEDRDGLVASNTVTGQFFELDFSAKEKLQHKYIANAVAIVVTNQRFSGIGIFSGGWNDIRRIAGEKFISAEVQDSSALLVTSDRLLSFYGRTGSWSQTKR